MEGGVWEKEPSPHQSGATGYYDGDSELFLSITMWQCNTDLCTRNYTVQCVCPSFPLSSIMPPVLCLCSYILILYPYV